MMGLLHHTPDRRSVPELHHGCRPLAISRKIVTTMLVLVIAGCASGGAHAGPPSAADWADLRVGDCFNSSEATGPMISLLPSEGAAVDMPVIVVPCGQPHSFEVFGLASEPSAAGASYPGDEAVLDRSNAACDPLFHAYVGIDYQASRLHARIRTPTAVQWSQGDRRFVCALFDPGQATLMNSQMAAFTSYTSEAFGFTVSLPSGWSAGPRPGDATGILLAGHDARVTIGVDSSRGATTKQFFDADAAYLMSAGATGLASESITSGDLDWSILQYRPAGNARDGADFDAMTVNGDRSFLLIWNSSRAQVDADLDRFTEIVRSFVPLRTAN